MQTSTPSLLAATCALNQHGATAELDAACEELFCKLIAQRTGIVLQDHQLSNLRDTVRKGCERFTYRDAAQYLLALQQAQSLTAPLEFLIAGVTVGESYFFRDSEQIDLLRNQLLPDMIAAKRVNGDLSLRVWSAGCAQGQEIFTVALLLQELIPDIEKWRIHLLGTDINSEVVAKAMRGHYSDWSFRATPMALRERWFTRVGHDYEIHPQLMRMVRFAYLNLMADVYPSILSETNALDLILCRNVFIYLDRQAVQRSMAQYADCLQDQGVLMLGASDPMVYKHTELELVQTQLVGYFRKGCARGTGLSGYQQPAQAIPIQKNWPNVDVPTAASQPRADAMQTPATEARQPTTERKNKPAGEMAEIITLLNGSAWAAAIALVETVCQHGGESSDLWQMKAKALASLGRLFEAQEACVRSLQLDTVNKHTYLIQGLILAELSRGQEAEHALRKALYLDHSFLEAHYEIGMLQVRARNLAAGIKSLEIALKLALAGNPERELHNASGMTYRRFAQVLQNEIEMLRGAVGEKPQRVVRLRGE
jgi:chemotaxis protein methyltransferase CheR